VDLGAIRHNASLLARVVAPAALCAVVKASGYGHGSVSVARAALDGGATWLAVALVEEGALLRTHGITAPVLLLSEPPADAMRDVLALGLTPTVYTYSGVEAAAKAVATGGDPGEPLTVHVKVDTGMHRVGAATDEAVSVVRAVADHRELVLGGVWTHFAVADEPSDPFTDLQCERFRGVVDELTREGLRPPLIHAANSAGALAHPQTRHDLVRCGIALYGVAPGPALAGVEPVADLRPALSLRAQVSFVKRVPAGEAVSYGLRRTLEETSTVATVPVGYADGVPWRLGVSGGEVLIGGRRRPLAGSVTMDQILVDCGADTSVMPGDEVVLLGRQGAERVTAWDWAALADTIAYEILCGISPRVPRIYG